MTIPIWKVQVEHEGDAFVAHVEGLREGSSIWARSLDDLDGEVRESIAVSAGLPSGAEQALGIDWDLPDL